MTDEPTFIVEHDGDRVALVPEFWPSELDADARRKYDGLRARHVVDDGALSMPAEYLPDGEDEPGSRTTLDAVWTARNHRLASFGVGLFRAADDERDRIARALLDEDDADREHVRRVLLDRDDDEPEHQRRRETEDCRA